MNEANIEELEMLEDWLKTPKNYLLFADYIKVNYAIDVNMNIFDNERAKKEYLEKIRQDKRNYKKRRYLRVFRYAAMFVGVLVITFFFRNNIFNTSIETTSIIVDSNVNNIKPGTDKATLTLGDGSVVTLEKGSSFQTDNIKSNGEQIIYKSGVSNKKVEVTYNYLTIPRGGQYFIELSDGTKVWLNSESQLKFPVNFIEGETRKVELVYGEAYFDVSPSVEHSGSKFKVLNQMQEIEVLGTEFNIKAYKDESNIYTTLVEGKVLIGNGIVKQNLVPSQQSNLNTETNTIIIEKVDIKEVISWKYGTFRFVDKPLTDIMKVISRWYDVDVVFENKELESVEFIGTIDKNQSIEEILLIMKSSSINSFEINNKTVTLK